MDESNLTKRRNEVLNKLIKQFQLKKEEAKQIVKSIESYCELVLHTMNKK
jgi:hypothetical protein